MRNEGADGTVILPTSAVVILREVNFETREIRTAALILSSISDAIRSAEYLIGMHHSILSSDRNDSLWEIYEAEVLPSVQLLVESTILE